MTDETHDAGWWSGGHGVDGAVGVIFQDKFVLDLNARWSQHKPLPSRISMTGLNFVSVMANGGLTRKWGLIRVMGGLGLGGVRVQRQVVQSYTRFKDDAASAPFWTFALNAHIDLSVQLIYGLDLGVRWAPMVLVRNYEEQPFFHISCL